MGILVRNLRVNSLDLFSAIWSPLWFCWDLVNNGIILYKTRQWVKASTYATKDEVIAQLLLPGTTESLKKALGIPDLKDLDAIKGTIIPEIWELRKRLQELNQVLQDKLSALDGFRSLEAKLVAQAADLSAFENEVRTDLAGLRKIDLVLDDESAKRLAHSLNSAAGAAAKVSREEIQAMFINAYQGKPEELKRDAPMIYQQLLSMGAPPEVARNVIMDGPAAVGSLVAQFGSRKSGVAIESFLRAMPYLKNLQWGR